MKAIVYAARTTQRSALLVVCAVAASCLDAGRLEVHPTVAHIATGDSVQFVAMDADAFGTYPIHDLKWTSSSPGTAEIDPTGLLIGRASGVSRVTANYGRQTAVMPVRVEPTTLVGAGDIAGCSWNDDEATAELLDTIPGTVFTVGDDAYPDGSAREFANCYGPTWGRHRKRTRPAPGNHEYRTSGASGYFGYFGASAGSPGVGYYSYDLGAWHIIVINSGTILPPTTPTISVDSGSPQEQWLRADLGAHRQLCTLAYWHHPRFSSGPSGSSLDMAAIWRALYEAGADIVISAHDHEYERFAPQTPDGILDSARGIREFVVGTGGATLDQFGPPLPNSEVRYAGFGVLKLTLQATSYRWEFVPTVGAVPDSGTGQCH